ncbi:unnamed protein product [Lactuca saligna]|uniref:Uncharacterized protein n=1 Tax=Lactuca saligna TaxID=75948 RepID=A0AA35YDA7_LACSI|nr:unnamed protein product [Lactuca saligna]
MAYTWHGEFDRQRERDSAYLQYQFLSIAIFDDSFYGGNNVLWFFILLKFDVSSSPDAISVPFLSTGDSGDSGDSQRSPPLIGLQTLLPPPIVLQNRVPPTGGLTPKRVSSNSDGSFDFVFISPASKVQVQQLHH